MKRRKIILFCAISLNISCSLIGHELGENVDKATGKDKYADQYAEEGLEVDVEIVKAILKKSKENKETWNDPWVAEQELKYCSQIPSCWNKRNTEQKSTSTKDSTKSTDD
jgi:hypothetical protein